MSSANDSANAGQQTGNVLKEGFAKVHGIGEALRGNINTFADSATNTDSTKSRAVAERGEQEFASGHYQGTGAGVTPADTAGERVNRAAQGEGSTFDHTRQSNVASTGTTKGTLDPTTGGRTL